MPSELKTVQDHARELVMANGIRNQVYEAMENLYWMRWPEEDKVTKQIQNVKVTRTPRARNALLGAMRLLIATDPIFSVPSDINDISAKQQADKIEKFIKANWFASGRVAGTPIHYDVIRSALLYSDIYIGINSTKDMKSKATGSSKAMQRRLDEINSRTPILYELYSPKTCYSERDTFGLKTFYRSVLSTAGSIEDTFGVDGKKTLRSHENKLEFKRNQAVTLNQYYDLKNRFIWLTGFEKPIVEEEHDLPCLPIACAIAEGSSLFDKPEEQREPFLYTAWKSGVIDRENLILTVMYTMLFSMGANPMFVDYLLDPDNPHPVDYSVPGGTVHYRVGEGREVMSKQIIDPAMMQGWEIANDLEMQSTIYRQALGEPVSSATPYSSYALMSQSGRLPLLATQRLASNAIAEACEIGLKIIKEEGGTAKAKYDQFDESITSDDIPDIVDIKVTLEIELPQDRLQMANAANMLCQGDNPLVSKRWGRENVLNIGQSADMDKEIWEENTANMFYRKDMMKQMAEIAQMEQMAMQPPQSMASGMPGSSPMPGVPPGGAMPQNPAMGMQGGPSAPQNMGTPPQPFAPPGPPPVEPAQPYPPLAPNLQPLRGRK
jgi:hypothetical protein